MVYCWEGREVEVTPRRLRPPLDESVSAWRRACDRETTPDRALRKMVAKVKKQYAKAARGEHERIVARYECRGGDIATEASGASVESLEVAARCPAISKLDDPVVLENLRAAYRFLGSARLHYCTNCDEQWPFFLEVGRSLV